MKNMLYKHNSLTEDKSYTFWAHTKTSQNALKCPTFLKKTDQELKYCCRQLKLSVNPALCGIKSSPNEIRNVNPRCIHAEGIRCEEVAQYGKILKLHLTLSSWKFKQRMKFLFCTVGHVVSQRPSRLQSISINFCWFTGRTKDAIGRRSNLHKLKQHFSSIIWFQHFQVVRPWWSS